jgi:hypothetical protein
MFKFKSFSNGNETTPDRFEVCFNDQIICRWLYSIDHWSLSVDGHYNNIHMFYEPKLFSIGIRFILFNLQINHETHMSLICMLDDFGRPIWKMIPNRIITQIKNDDEKITIALVCPLRSIEDKTSRLTCTIQTYGWNSIKPAIAGRLPLPLDVYNYRRISLTARILMGFLPRMLVDQRFYNQN